MTDEDLKKIRSVVQEELEPIKRTLEAHTKILDEHTERLDALTADVIDLQDRADSIWERVSADGDKTKQDISDIKHHLGLAAS